MDNSELVKILYSVKYYLKIHVDNSMISSDQV